MTYIENEGALFRGPVAREVRDVAEGLWFSLQPVPGGAQPAGRTDGGDS